MRIAIATIALLLAGPAYAEEFKPPRIVVTGSPADASSMGDALQAVIKKYKEALPGCTKLATELPRLEVEDDTVFVDRQNHAYVFCMAEEFAADGLSVMEDVPTISGN